jgi:hypothetical protein
MYPPLNKLKNNTKRHNIIKLAAWLGHRSGNSRLSSDPEYLPAVIFQAGLARCGGADHFYAFARSPYAAFAAFCSLFLDIRTFFAFSRFFRLKHNIYRRILEKTSRRAVYY